MNISFTDYLFGSFTSNSSLILCKPELSENLVQLYGDHTVAATATINGKDVSC